jgi:hypothetical protein
MESEPKPRQRKLFQFTVADLLAFTLVAALGMALLAWPLPHYFSDTAENHAASCIVVLLVTLASAAIAVLLVNWTSGDRRVRTLAIIECCLLSFLTVRPIQAQILSYRVCSSSAAAAACLTFAEAQGIYHRTDYDGDGVLEYSQHITGTNSLCERTAGMGDLALVDHVFAAAEGPPSAKRPPKAGYCFMVLTAQGPHATRGRMSYIDKNGNMTKGYAVIAYPSLYGVTGQKCFMICWQGTIYEKDLGPDTHAIVEKMTEFDPDPSWEASE